MIVLHLPTSKSLAAGALLRQNSIEALDERITYTREDLSNYNPITESMWIQE